MATSTTGTNSHRTEPSSMGELNVKKEETSSLAAKVRTVLTHDRAATVAAVLAMSMFSMFHFLSGNYITSGAFGAPAFGIAKVAFPEQEAYLTAFKNRVEKDRQRLAPILNSVIQTVSNWLNGNKETIKKAT